jgi:hydrogenase maturation protease
MTASDLAVGLSLPVPLSLPGISFREHPLRTLVIGYGNPSRRDDGVGLAVVNGLRERLGQPPLLDGEDGYDDLLANPAHGARSTSARPADTLFLQQLMPELAETLAGYDRVWFVDAHLGVIPDPVRRVALTPSMDPAMVSHHLKPEALLALAAQLYGRAPQGELFSIRGFDFNFGEELSAETAVRATQVVVELWSALERTDAK